MGQGTRSLTCAETEQTQMAKSGAPLARTSATRAEIAPVVEPTSATGRRDRGEHFRPRLRTRRRDDTRHNLFTLLTSLTLLLVDTVALFLSFVSAYRLRDITGSLGPNISPPRETYLLLVTVATGAILTVFAVSGLYRNRRAVSRMDEFYRVVTHVSLGLIVAIAGTSLVLGEEFVYSRQMVAYGWFFAIVAVTTGRFFHAGLVGTLRARGVASDRLLIVGTGVTGRVVLDKIRRSPQLGYDVVGFVCHTPADDVEQAEVDGVPLLGTTAELSEVVEEHTIDELIIALSGTPHEDILDIVYSVTDSPVAIRVYPDSFRLLTTDSLNITDLNGLPTVSVRTIGLRRIDRLIKRAVDLVISIGVLVCLSPLMLVIAALVKLTSPGPVFYVQERVGQDGRAFQLLKFRSMPINAEADSGPVFTAKNDPRPTRFGRFIRRYSLDELPQFINVLLGEMSVVGPRPERPYFVEQFRQRIPAYMARHHEKSGVTGWAQVNGLRGDTSIEERTRYDLYYVENWSLLFDLKIIIKTLFHIFRSDSNAY
jgi:exopolysaccharide biosynthesis polyprenyl glycosylphosphotransferase